MILTAKTMARVSRTKLSTSWLNKIAKFSKDSVIMGSIGVNIAVFCDSFKCSQNPHTALDEQQKRQEVNKCLK